MATSSKEAQLILAIQSLKNNPQSSRRATAKIYNVPETTLRRRMAGTPSKAEQGSATSRLTKLEERVIVEYIIDLDSRGFSPRLCDVEDMANVIAEARDASRVGTH